MDDHSIANYNMLKEVLEKNQTGEVLSLTVLMATEKGLKLLSTMPSPELVIRACEEAKLSIILGGPGKEQN